MRILFLLLIFSQTSLAQKSLTQHVFQVNVRPVLSAILSDFYQMITHFPEFPKELVGVVDEMDEFHGEKELLMEKCPRVLNQECLDNINLLRKRLATIQAKTLELLARQKMSPNLHLNPMSGIRNTYQFQTHLEDIKGELDNVSLMLNAKVTVKKNTHSIVKKLDELGTYVSLTVIEYIPFAYKEDFRHFYFHFIHPLQLQISKIKNYEFLNRNVNNLNFALNLLVQNLTKRNKKTPEGMAPYLSIIHNRWNSLLRYYF